MAKETLVHKEKKDSTAKWFIIGIIPILNLYYLWKSAENVAGHEKATKKYEYLDHLKPKDDTIKWFAIFLSPMIIGALIGAVTYFLASTDTWMFFYFSGGSMIVMALTLVLAIVTAAIGLYILWKLAEVVSGHDKVYNKHESLEHKEKKDSTIKWFIIGLIPIVNLYFFWKMAETISGHEQIYE
ncbi:MAG: hypothetical protein KGY45_04520 [Hadesarchaea archaeon]|nr:hypothetical protein [Hadesarchaea archaeon]